VNVYDDAALEGLAIYMNPGVVRDLLAEPIGEHMLLSMRSSLAA
jgi:hypothetical protein